MPLYIDIHISTIDPFGAEIWSDIILFADIICSERRPVFQEGVRKTVNFKAIFVLNGGYCVLTLLKCFLHYVRF